MSKKRLFGLVLFIVGLVILIGSYIVTGGTWRGFEENDLAITALFVGIPLVLSGLLTLALPERLLQSNAEKINRLEKRVAQLEQERKNTP